MRRPLTRPRLAPVVLSCLFALFLATAPAPSRAEGTAGIDSFRQLALADKGFPVAARTVKFQRLELELASGVLTPIVGPGGDRLGLLFEGDGKMLLRVTDPRAARTFAENARLADGGIAVGPDNLRDDFKRILLLSGRPVLDELVAGEATVATAGDSRETLKKLLAATDRSETGFDHLAAEARFNELDGQYVYAEFEGGKVRLGYAYDRVRGNTESIFSFVQYPGYDVRYRRWIAVQDLDTRALVEFSLEKASFRIDTPDNRKGTIASRLELEVERDGIRILPFDLINNRDPKNEAWSATGNPLTVLKVTDGEGRALGFSHRYHELLVDLGAPVKRGTRVTLTVETAAEVFTGPEGYRDDNYIDLYAIDWYPKPLSIAARRFTFDISVRTKKPYRPVTSGDTVSFKTEGEHFLLEAKSDVPVWDVAFFAGKYKTKEIEFEGRKVYAHAYAVGRDQDIEQLASVTAMFLGIYEKMFGPYPHKELELVEIPTFSFYGVSPSGVVILTTRTFQPKNDLMREYLGNEGVNHLVAHEVAHQWFAHKAWPQFPSEDNWLTESLAEYASGLATGVAVQAKGTSTAKILDFKQMLGQWRTYSAMADKTTSIAGANLIGGDLGPTYRFYLLYCRGPLVLHQLRTLIGEERYLAIMRKFLDGANFGPVATDDLAKAASQVVGQDLTWYFDQWVEEPGTPEIKVETKVVPAAAGGFQLDVRLTQAAGAGFKKIHVPLILDFPGGKKGVKLAFQEKPVQDFSFPLEAQPDKVTVDPGKNTLANYR
ncbi:MAG: hypothetical protein MUF27_11340 [Acidobacteria bacterium]|jgi:hypothetical protein|nr:hypothetical protein [Acidobacteriota bacterium]